MICKKLIIKPQEMVHIGDHKEFDYLVPQKLGITAFYLDRNKTSTGLYTVHNLSQFEEILIKRSSPSQMHREKEL
jgi:putative hydrolase of the HAD superfamily